MASYPVPTTVRGYRTVPLLRLAATLIAVAIFWEFASGVLGGFSFEDDSFSRWEAYLAAPLKTAAMLASIAWWRALYWLRGRTARPVYAAIALAIVSGCLIGGLVGRSMRADQKTRLTSPLRSLQLGHDFTAATVTYRAAHDLDVPTATRSWTAVGDMTAECQVAGDAVRSWSGARTYVFTSTPTQPSPYCQIGTEFHGLHVNLTGAVATEPGTWNLEATITPT